MEANYCTQVRCVCKRRQITNIVENKIDHNKNKEIEKKIEEEINR